MSDMLFTRASRARLRFESPNGLLTVEDLWEIPLTVPEGQRAKRASLDNIAIELNSKRTGAAATVSFVTKEAHPEKSDLDLKFEIVLYIINVRVAEDKAKAEKAANAVKKQKLLEVLAQKENEALTALTTDELRKLINEL